MIQGERLWHRLMELGEIGKQDSGGVTRLSFTPEDRNAKALTASYMKEAGLEVREDAVGNLIGRKEGSNPQLAPIIIGSHIDTVYDGGRFDGALGVLSGIEVLQSIGDNGIILQRSVEVVAFTDEEGARFGFGMIGSRAMAGTLKASDLAHCDQEGVSIQEAMLQDGLNPAELKKAASSAIHAYLELHIEQGKVLESQGKQVGIVTGISGPLWMKVTLEGEAGHAGATPMRLRRDPLAVAAALMVEIEQIASSYPGTVATVGKLQVYPGGINIIPSKVEFSIDLRDIDAVIRDQAEVRIRKAIQTTCEAREISWDVEDYQRVPPTPCSEDLQAVITEACIPSGVDPVYLPSGAGHDAMQFREVCPIGMIFVRSREGISHSPSEWSTQEDCEKGTELLYHTLLLLDGRTESFN
ncbi:Zn-dependent hydrolase [Paenibacillus abyssi]|uniref:Zn-dependent hydrolase n=1 Tax=Paenibacillus abyssi TaxID=1340531 RepID=A0A917CVQ6_9BACL|nr:Zn-dependent hydrolase [Paenibacillus abyssi]GGF97470.1 Zn-dependent hydrolase [Paenibacillus abyssi]